MKVNRFTFNMFGVNTYVLWDEQSKDAIIIDPGMINDNERHMFDCFIESNKLNPIHLINTHMHIDHSFGVVHVSQKYGLKLECNIADQFLAERLTNQAIMFGLTISIEDLIIGKNIHDGDKLKIGNEEILMLHVPGHSLGSVVLYAPDSSFIISGDVLFYKSIGRTDLPGGNYTQLIEGIKNKLLALPIETIVYPGHGQETTIGEELHNNPYL